MLFDLRTLQWSDNLLSIAGLPKYILPPAFSSQESAGKVTRQAAAATGLKAGTPVCLGGHDHICAAIAAGNTHTIDLGLANGRTFIGQADVGLGALVQREVSTRWKGRIGVAALVNRFLKTLPRARPWQYRLRVNGQERQGTMWGLFALNIRRQVWRLKLGVPGSDDDGLLQVVVLAGCSRRRLLSIAASVALRDTPLARIPEIEVFAANSVELDTCPAALWEVDGEVEEPARLSLRVYRKALRLVVPVGYLRQFDSCATAQAACGSRNLDSCSTP
jgi:diacylglycerol kinase family enzyme